MRFLCAQFTRKLRRKHSLKLVENQENMLSYKTFETCTRFPISCQFINGYPPNHLKLIALFGVYLNVRHQNRGIGQSPRRSELESPYLHHSSTKMSSLIFTAIMLLILGGITKL